MKNRTKFSIGFFSGVLIGILFAPEKGYKIRRGIKRNTQLCKKTINKLFNRGKDELDEIKAALQDENHEMTSDIRLKLIKLVEETQKGIEESEEE